MKRGVSRRQLAVFVAEHWVSAKPADRKRLMQQVAAYLVARGRSHEVDLLVNDIAHELLQTHGQLSLELATARPLTPAARKAISAELREQTGATEVSVHETVVPELVGGFIARTADAEVDASLRHGLRKLAAIA